MAKPRRRRRRSGRRGQQGRRQGEGSEEGSGQVGEGQAAPAEPKAAPSKAAGKGQKFVYLFGRKTDGNGTMKPLLGGKGANLAEMCRIGLPVPPGFTITTEVCTYYYANKRTYPPALQQPDGRPASRRSSRRPARSSAT